MTPLSNAQRQKLYRARLRTEKMQRIINQITKLERQLSRLANTEKKNG